MKEPHSESAEKAVLGGVLSDPQTLSMISPVIGPDDFYAPAHKVIYGAMLALDDKQISIDLVTLVDHLRESNRLSAIGGAAYLSQLYDDCPSAANIKQHAKTVKKKAELRRIIDGAREMAEQAKAPGAEPEDIPTRLSIEISHGPEVNHVESVIKKLNKNIEKGYPGLPPCYDLLARTIRKVSPGHLYVVGAYTSIGKSAWLVDFICRMYRYGLANPGIAIFSTEMSCEQYLLRMLSNETSIPTWAITEKRLKDTQWPLFTNAQIFYASRNLYIYDRLYKIEDIEKTCRLLKDRGLDIIAIDYLQNMWGEGTIYDRMSRLAPILQYLAKDLQITIIALSQVSNEHQRNKGSNGGVFGYKGAGEIAASADLGIELERDPVDKEQMLFKVSKNRHGRVGEGVLRYVDGWVRLEEVREEQPEYGG